MRRLSPPRPVRLHRFSSPAPVWRRLMRKAQRLPLLVPLCAGLSVAGLVDAMLPSPERPRLATATVAHQDTDATEPATAPAPAELVIQGPPQGDAVLTVPALVEEAHLPPAPAPVDEPERTSPSAPSTRNQALEAQLDAMLKNGQTPYGAVVIMEAATGRVVAIAEHSTRGSSDGLALRPMAPAASVFKVVTASALLEAGVPASERVCFHGGKTRMKPRDLKDSRQDNRCVTLSEAVPQSANVAVAKLATSHLTPELLREHTQRWGFGSTFGIEGMQPSFAHIPDDPFTFAEAAAGFGDVKISAMHGAVLASIVANDGLLVTPTWGKGQQGRASRAIDARAARSLRRMMADTVATGTGRRAFQQKPALGQTAGGKTGSLTDYKTGLDTSWFVGFAPAEAPEFIVSAVVVNTSKWHIKAPWLAKESLRLAFKDRGTTTRGARVAAR